MCVESDDLDKDFVDYGIIFNVEIVYFFFDGRFIVYIVGGRRFRVILRSMVDGYYIVIVEWL